MPTISKLPILQYFGPLFKNPPETKIPLQTKMPLETKLAKQQNTSWTLSKTAKAAAAILSALGLSYAAYQHFNKKTMPFRDDTFANPTGNVSKIIAAITLISTFAYFFKKEIFITNKENKTFQKTSEKTQNSPILSEEIRDKYAKFNELIKSLEERSKPEHRKDLVRSDFSRDLNYLCRELSQIDKIVTYDEWQLYGESLKNFYSYYKKFTPIAALKLAIKCQELLKNNPDKELYNYFTDKVQTKIQTTFEEDVKKDLEKKKPNGDTINTHPIIPLEKENSEISPSNQINRIISILNEVFFKLSEDSLYESEYKKLVDVVEDHINQGFIQIEKNEYSSELEYRKLASIINILLKHEYSKEMDNEDLICQFARNSFNHFLNAHSDAALDIAYTCVTIAQDKKSKHPKLAAEAHKIVRYATDNDALAREFAMICAEGSEDHKKIAEEIWLNCIFPLNLDKMTQYLIGCSKISDHFCQDKLLQRSDVYPLKHSLIQACADHLFEENAKFDFLVGNKAVIFEALSNLRYQDDNTYEFLLPIAKGIIESFKKAKNITDEDFHWILCSAISNKQEETEILLGCKDAEKLLGIAFDLYLAHSDYNSMKSLLQNCLAEPCLHDFLGRAEKAFSICEDSKWKQIFDENFDIKYEQNTCRIS